ncbi:hypothetical protein DH2020_004461 [Rehmannia glutinosa]|uniref:Pectinesterase n=1 Tax=Rehmannia glutinosa TaxID=99300 RepID=A0ABR0XPG3_REHGL
MAAKRTAIIGLFATLVVVAATAAAIIVVQKKHKELNNHKINESQKAIQSLCQNTYYQQTCITTLSKATNSSNPKTLIQSGFQIAIDELRHVINQTAPLQEASRDPETAGAYKTCQKLLDDSITDLQTTVDQIESFDTANFNMLMDDIKTWLTGALTYQETCLDCFEEVKGEDGEKMRQLLEISRELTINGLALANEFSNFLVPTEFGFSRRLLAHIEPADDYDYGYVGRNLENFAKTPKSRRLLQADPGNVKPNVIVAGDGSGKYTTINEALQEVPFKSNETFVIYIKEGVYQEYVTINKTMWSVMFIGDGPTKTRIIGNRSKIGGYETFWTATVAIEGDNFIAKNIGFENSAGASMHQAVALRVSADKTIFHNCQIDGFQDTLYAHNHRQFYRDCTISGTIDFIFGNARAVLQNCTLLIRKPLENQKLCMVTAQGRTLVNQTSAVVLQNCRVKAGPDYPVADTSYRAYLGRPWKEYSRTIVMDSELDGLIHPDGWSSWNDSSAHLDTCWYAEVNNKGPGADLTKRVTWPGIKKISVQEAEMFTPGEFMFGHSWIADE